MDKLTFEYETHIAMGWETRLVFSNRLFISINHLIAKDGVFYYISDSNSYPFIPSAFDEDDMHFMIGRFDMVNEVSSYCEERDDASRTTELLTLLDISGNFYTSLSGTSMVSSFSFSYATATGDSFSILTVP